MLGPPRFCSFGGWIRLSQDDGARLAPALPPALTPSQHHEELSRKGARSVRDRRDQPQVITTPPATALTVYVRICCDVAGELGVVKPAFDGPIAAVRRRIECG